MSLEDTESLPVNYYFKKKIEWFLREFKHVKDLDEVICQIIKLKELRFHYKLTDKLQIDRRSSILRPLKVGIPLTREEIQKVPLIKIGYENLNDPFLYPYFKKDLINFPDFYFLYKFLEAVYFLDIGHFLKKEDLEKLYFCRLDENIISNLDDFEDLSGLEITLEFFVKLKHLGWENKETDTFFNQLNRARIDMIYDFTEFSDIDYSGSLTPSGIGFNRPNVQMSAFPPLHKRAYILFGIPINRRVINYGIFLSVLPYGSPYFNFPATENAFLLFLSGCSAVNSNCDVINENDVIRAYKTYYKLLTTNISRIVDELLEEKFMSK